MEISAVDIGRVTVVQISGWIDSRWTVFFVEKLYDKIIKQKRYRIIINFKEVTFLGSTAMKMIAEFRLFARRYNRGDLRFCCVPETIQQVLTIASLLPLVKLFDTEKEAVESFGEQYPG